MYPMQKTMQKVRTFLWFDDRAEEAAKFYTSIIKNSKITSVTNYGDAGPGPEGSPMVVRFELDGQEFLALNGGPMFHFTPAISLVVGCETQQEIDDLWERLSEGGEKSQCGWLTDKFGLSWQIVPAALDEFMSDPKKANNVMKAVLKMTKIDIKELQAAYDRG
jgi:predicted 3-demethylubiquinone-9 3-methyltransferase (glyoxalase superfamily)